jgi:transposase
MLSFPSSVRIFLCLQPADMRRSFDGLSRMVDEVIGEDPLSGYLFVFLNKRSNRMKILYWDRDGFALWYKRLEEGAFCFPHAEGDSVAVNSTDLSMILDGVDFNSIKRKKRYKLNSMN